MASVVGRPVRQYVNKLNAEEKRRRAAEEASMANRQRKADTREAKIQRSSELVSQPRHRATQVSEADTNVDESSSSQLPSSLPEAVEIGSVAVPSGNFISNTPLPPSTSNDRLLSGATSQIKEIEAQLKNQNTRIKELETSCDRLTKEVSELRKKRDKAQQELLEATEKRSEDLKQHEEIVASLRRQIEGLIEERSQKEEKIEQLTVTVRELRRALEEERDKVAILEAKTQMLDKFDGAVSSPTTAAAIDLPLGTSNRRASAGESERRRGRHGKTQISGSGISFTAEFKWGSEGKKSKRGNHK